MCFCTYIGARVCEIYVVVFVSHNRARVFVAFGTRSPNFVYCHRCDLAGRQLGGASNGQFEFQISNLATATVRRTRGPEVSFRPKTSLNIRPVITGGSSGVYRMVFMCSCVKPTVSDLLQRTFIARKLSSKHIIKSCSLPMDEGGLVVYRITCRVRRRIEFSGVHD